MTNLAYFDAEGCSLTGSIPSWIGKWSMLETLALTDNAMTGILPSGLFQLTDLRMLFLDGNSFSGDLSNMNGLTSLSYAYLDRNAFSQNIDDTFLVGLRQLTQLDISENNFVGTVPVHLFDDKLEVFDVNDNFLTSFPDDISNQTLRPLWFLTIFNNPIEGPFPSSILNLPNLAHFDATTTKLTGAMPTELGSLTKLSYLFLANTKFLPGPIPDVYQQLTLLADLSLKKSSRTGSIPTWVGLLDRLVLLDLDYNDFSGSVPSEIGDMASLTFLLLNRNSLTGPVPTQVGSLIDLRTCTIVKCDVFVLIR
jgi:Leucine-rich repeat (LRR) protein